MSHIGFVVLTHGNPRQLTRLATRLTRSYGQVPIVCHHDFDRTALDEREHADLFDRVQFVRPHVRTRWANWSLVEAFLRALRAMYARPDAPEWVVFLSGADYPVQRPSQVLADLEASGADAYLDHRLVDPTARLPHALSIEPKALGYMPGEGAYNRWLVARRYYGLTLRTPGIDHSDRFRPRHFVIYDPRWTPRFAPFGAAFRCYAGSQWFTLRRSAATYLLDWDARNPWLARHYARASTPDESYVQCVLANAPALRLDANPRRFIDWMSWDRHPVTLTMEHAAAIAESGAHFARKFDPAKSAELLAALDAYLDGETAAVPAASVPTFARWAERASSAAP
jgi:hypothetical protein